MSLVRSHNLAPDRQLFLTDRNLYGVTTMADSELEELVAWMREPLFFMREQSCEDDFDEDSGEDDDGQ